MGEIVIRQIKHVEIVGGEKTERVLTPEEVEEWKKTHITPHSEKENVEDGN